RISSSKPWPSPDPPTAPQPGNGWSPDIRQYQSPSPPVQGLRLCPASRRATASRKRDRRHRSESSSACGEPGPHRPGPQHQGLTRQRAPPPPLRSLRSRPQRRETDADLLPIATGSDPCVFSSLCGQTFSHLQTTCAFHNPLDNWDAPDYTRCQFALPSRKEEDLPNDTPASGDAKICSPFPSFAATFSRFLQFLIGENISLDYDK